ncbi:MAG: coproporphyrinogen III oxidase family protein [Planctomycetes bacterium]|nr:coproporphyrinogen III oxidase family protein [Planctomycetota bacterium]
MVQLDVISENQNTEVGSYFVANYPPFSAWSADHTQAALDALSKPPTANPLGLYIHIPFCRKRCRFCYFRVYTDKNSGDIDRYLSALSKEIELYSRNEYLHNRNFEFVYFGGGTPSYLSGDQLRGLVDKISQHWRWDKAREVTFECEPGTLKKSKLEAIKEIGVTRLSLGIEHFDDDVLEFNGRAHRSREIAEAYAWAREVGFDQINVDLIAGMAGDTEEKWHDTVAKTLALSPDNLTIYQMEVPQNSTLAREARDSGGEVPIADWPTKRRWVAHAFDLFCESGYEVSSAYTVAKSDKNAGFIYRDSLWRGADMIGTGVASFSFANGAHFQNADSWADYLDAIANERLPIARAFPASDQQRMIRELVLQHKLGHVDAGYFRNKFGVEITTLYADVYDAMKQSNYVHIDGDDIRLTQDGLLRVDALLPFFFESNFRSHHEH